jgi:hypothetical protein
MEERFGGSASPSTVKDRGGEPGILAGESNLRPRERNDRGRIEDEKRG